MPIDADGPRRRATITEVARHLNVSKSTVSRAFNRPGMLLPETVSRVHEAAALLGYSPSRTAMALSTGLHSTIAVVVPDIANPFFPRLIRSAQARANARGMSCLLGDSDESAERERALVTEFAPDVHGFVLMSSRLTDDELRELARATNIVLINRDTAGMRRVLLDTTSGLKDALDALYTLGHRRFAYIGGPERSWSHSQRLSTVQEFAEERGVSVTVDQAAPATFDGGADAAHRVIRSEPTAFLCFDDVVAQGVTAALSSVGLRIPHDVSIVGCDDTLATTVYPAMATIRLDYEEAARAAVDMVLDGAGVGAGGSSRRVFVGRFVQGATLAEATS